MALRYHIDGTHDPVAPYIDNQPITHNLLGLIRRERTAVHVVFGEAIRHAGHSRKQMAELSRAAIVEALRGPDQIPLAQRVAAPQRAMQAAL